MARQADFSLTLAHPDYLGILRRRPPGQLRILVRYLRPLGVARSGWPPARVGSLHVGLGSANRAAYRAGMPEQKQRSGRPGRYCHLQLFWMPRTVQMLY